MTRARCLIPATVLATTLGGTALAQAPIQPPRAPNMPPPESTIPEKMEPQDPSATGSTRPDAPLSEKLEATDGVIRPPSGIDPGITAPAPVPDPGTTPIIPPPGSPGGNQNIEPK